MLQLHDVVRIKDLRNSEEEWNGTLALCISDEYVHPKLDCKVIRIKIADTLWAIELANVTKVTESERLEYFKNLDGNQIVPWEQCHWQPNRERKDFNI